MRVLFVIAEFKPKRAGAEIQAERLAKALSALGVTVEILTEKPKGLPRTEVDEGILIRRVNRPNRESLRLLGLIPGIFTGTLQYGRRCDVIHIHQALHASFGAMLGARLLTKPSIVKIGNSRERFDLNMFSEMFPQILTRKMARYVAKSASMFVALNQSIFDDLLRWGVAANKIISIPNGVPIGSKQTILRKYEARRILKLPEEEKIIAHTGNLSPKKNHTLLLGALAKLKKRERCPLLLLIGSGPLREAIEAEAVKIGVQDRVLFIGKVDDVYPYLYAADAFVLPSVTEGMSNSLLEAMSIGLPCVASNIPGNRTVIDHAKTGLLFPAGDTVALSQALENVLYDLKASEAFGVAAYEVAKERFAIHNVAQQYKRLYQELLGT